MAWIKHWSLTVTQGSAPGELHFLCLLLDKLVEELGLDYRDEAADMLLRKVVALRKAGSTGNFKFIHVLAGERDPIFDADTDAKADALTVQATRNAEAVAPQRPSRDKRNNNNSRPRKSGGNGGGNGGTGGNNGAPGGGSNNGGGGRRGGNNRGGERQADASRENAGSGGAGPQKK